MIAKDYKIKSKLIAVIIKSIILLDFEVLKVKVRGTVNVLHEN